MSNAISINTIPTNQPIILLQDFNIEKLNTAINNDPGSIVLSIKLLKKESNKETKIQETLITVNVADITDIAPNDLGDPVHTRNINTLINFVYLRCFQLFVNNNFNIAVCEVFWENDDPYFNNGLLEIVVTKNNCKLSNLI